MNSSTSKNITFREFRKEDTPFIADMIRESWNYDQFCTPKTARKLSLVFLYSCLNNQTYTQVALHQNIPVGIIMGNVRTLHRTVLKYRLKQIGALLSLYLSKEGRRVMKTFESVSSIDKELLAKCPFHYDGEIAFFAVSSRARKKGVGKSLFCTLLDYMKASQVRRFYLFTDTSCNYGFYEHQGMQRRGQKNTSFVIENQKAEMSFFLYDQEL